MVRKNSRNNKIKLVQKYLTPLVSKLNIIIVILLALLISATTYIVGWNKGYESYTPKIVTVTEYHTVYEQLPPETVIEQVEVVKPFYIETKVPYPVVEYVQLTDWNSLDELKEFLANDDTDESVTVESDNGTIDLSGVCEDYAFQLRARAAYVGRYLTVQVIGPTEYTYWYEEPTTSNHALCIARVGNAFYYVEPVNDKVWFRSYLD